MREAHRKIWTATYDTSLEPKSRGVYYRQQMGCSFSIRWVYTPSRCPPTQKSIRRHRICKLTHEARNFFCTRLKSNLFTLTTPLAVLVGCRRGGKIVGCIQSSPFDIAREVDIPPSCTPLKLSIMLQKQFLL